MSLIKIIQSLFGRSKQVENLPAIAFTSVTPTVSPGSYESHIANQNAAIELETQTFINKYGPDFFSFLYRPDADQFIRQEVIPFRNPNSLYNNFLDNDHWRKKNPLNFPGPFYTGESDTCATGIYEAPDNVLLDADACEFIFKQPQNYSEFLHVLEAAAVEVFDSYSCNGNNNWTYQKCKDWWKNKDDLLNDLRSEEFEFRNGDSVQLYINYLNGPAETDLRKYCYLLENGVYPVSDIHKLPEL